MSERPSNLYDQTFLTSDSPSKLLKNVCQNTKTNPKSKSFLIKSEKTKKFYYRLILWVHEPETSYFLYVIWISKKNNKNFIILILNIKNIQENTIISQVKNNITDNKLFLRSFFLAKQGAEQKSSYLPT